MAVALAFAASIAACGKSTQGDEISHDGEAGMPATGQGGGVAGSGGSGFAGSAAGGSAMGAAAGSSAGGGVTGGTAGGTGGDAGSACEIQYSLEQYCEGLLGCPATEEDARERIADACPLTPTWVIFVRKGCGMVVVGLEISSSAHGFVFDEASGELIGAYHFSRATDPPCDISVDYGGVWPGECAEMTQCDLCAPVQNLECRFDCDCSEAPGVDPCVAPTSCGCYCQRLSGTRPIPEW